MGEAHPDLGSVEAGGIRFASSTGRWILLASILGSALAGIDATVVNVALPAIGHDFRVDFAVLQWVVTAYTLTLAALILLGGSLGDRYGRRRVFTVGVIWFASASLLCGVAPGAGWLIAGRALQGVGGALLTPGSLAMIQASFHPDDRSRAIGSWSAFGGVATAIGPFLGGWLIDSVSWRLIFLINPPLAVLAVVIARRHVPESRDPTAHGRVDVLGAAFSAVGLAGVTYAIIAAPTHGIGSAEVSVSGGLGIVAFAMFFLTEDRRSQPMLPLSIFSSQQFSAANAVTFAVYGAFGGVFFLLAVQLQVVSGFSPLAAGVALLPVTVAMLVLSARFGQLAQRIGPRVPMTVGPLVCAAGVLLMLRIGPRANYAGAVLPAVAALGLGLAILVAPLTAAVLAAVGVEHAGVASGVNNAVARAAGLIAVAAFPAVTGLSGRSYNEPATFSHGFHLSLIIAAALLVAGAAIAAGAIRRPVAPDAPAEPTAPSTARRSRPALGIRLKRALRRKVLRGPRRR